MGPGCLKFVGQMRKAEKGIGLQYDQVPMSDEGSRPLNDCFLFPGLQLLLEHELVAHGTR